VLRTSVVEQSLSGETGARLERRRVSEIAKALTPALFHKRSRRIAKGGGLGLHCLRAVHLKARLEVSANKSAGMRSTFVGGVHRREVPPCATASRLITPTLGRSI
jgi:hypothetical protein